MSKLSIDEEINNLISDEKTIKCIPDVKHEIPMATYGIGKIIAYIVYLIILISFVIYTQIDHDNKDLKKKIFSLMSSNQENEFEKTLYLFVYGTLIILMTISVIYNIDYYNVSYAKTFATFSKPKYLLLLLLSSFIKSISYVVISIMIILLRKGIIKNHIKFISSISSVIFLFEILLESCGYNKWLDHEEISKCKSLYNDISDINPSDDIDTQTQNMNLINISQKGDPFQLSFSKLSTFFIFVCIVFLVIKMFIITGINSKKHKLRVPISKFLVEIIIIGIVGLISLYLSLKVKKNNKEFFTKNNILIGSIIPIILHIMSEYNNMYLHVTI